MGRAHAVTPGPSTAATHGARGGGQRFVPRRREKRQMSVCIIEGDCLAGMRSLATEGVTVQSVVTDPPYGLNFMGKEWDRGVPGVPFWAAARDLLPPGGHLVAFGGTRTFHRMAVAIEDAGFELRDTLMWLYGTGFPKSRDIGKAIDKALGVAGTFGGPKSAAHAGWIDRGRMRGDENEEGWQRPWMDDPEAVDKAAREYLPGSDAAQRFKGWGTALKPAWEPIILARKPLVGTVAANVLAHGVGAINVDGCRVAGGKEVPAPPRRAAQGSAYGDLSNATGDTGGFDPNLGRWPANVLHDGSDEVEAAFAAFGDRSSPWIGNPKGVGAKGGKVFGGGDQRVATKSEYADSGTASRFFYSAKASAADRAGSKHPTVKPVALMRWLVRLVTPPGGVVLDPFAGSGTTGAAAAAEGMRAVLIERDAESVADIRRRLSAPPMQPQSTLQDSLSAEAQRQGDLLRDAPPGSEPYPRWAQAGLL